MAEQAARLSEREISERLGGRAGWEFEDGKLTKTFRFDDFMGAVEFVNRVARVAESEGHHPDLGVSWGRVVVDLTTHSAGGVSDKDFKLASLIDGI
jgi:4a-hydroxytetrahydrobiopterin dehydratase